VSPISDTELMAMLSGALTTPPVAPDQVTLARLRATLTELSRESSINVVTRVGRTKGFAGLRSRVARHTTFVAVATLLFTGGVATAGVATDTLPGPTRNLAYDLGLPVTSPGLYHARTNLEQLKQSINERNHNAEVRWGRSLQHDLKSLNGDDLAKIRLPALSLLSEVGLEDPLGPSSSTSTTTSSTVITSTTTPTTDEGSNSDRNSSVPPSTVPDGSDSDSSDANIPNSNPFNPTLTVPNPTQLVPTTVANGGGSGGGDEFQPTTTQLVNPDEATTVVTLSPVSGDQSGEIP
jgi:hypothetical protein